MTKHIFVLMAAAMLFIFACNNSSDEDSTEEESASVSLETLADSFAYSEGNTIAQQIAQQLQGLDLQASSSSVLKGLQAGYDGTIETPELASEADSMSYQMASRIGTQIKKATAAGQMPFELSLEAMKMGIADQLEGKELAMNEAEKASMMNAVNTVFRKKMEAQALAQMTPEQKEQYQANLAKGEAFLAENKGKDGVQETASGLQYIVVEEGTGPKPTAQSVVEVHYEGTLIEGKVFDSSIERGEPVQFPVGGVIQGWQEALQLMPEGSKWKVFIPAGLAYGVTGSGADIGPGETLVFDVELLKIVK